VPAENGTTDFSVLQNELKGKSARIVLVACLQGLGLKAWSRRLPTAAISPAAAGTG
jgi:hypothetical protein